MTVIKRFNNAFGTTTDSPLGSTATTMNSQELPRLGVVDSANNEIARLTLDPERNDGAPEIIHVTSYDGTATSVTIERGKEGTTAREHASGTTWEHAPTVEDFDLPAVKLGITANQGIASGTVAEVSWDTTVFDNTGGRMWDSASPTILTLPDAGIYVVTAGVAWANDDTGPRIVRFRQDGSTGFDYFASQRVPAQGTSDGVVASLLEVSSAIDLVLEVYQESGGTLDLQSPSNDDPVFFAAQKVGEL